MCAAHPTESLPGRSCPLSYRYSPAVFNRAAELHADTVYVIGGLYGNLPALETIFALAAHEPVAPSLVFNGDFNWFNCDAAGFEAINRQVLRHIALRGNVETAQCTPRSMVLRCVVFALTQLRCTTIRAAGSNPFSPTGRRGQPATSPTSSA